jgi:hypothetical protein
LKHLVIGLLVLAAAPAWAVHRCTGPGGSVVFQDLPCAVGGQELAVKPASGTYDPAAGEAARARVQQVRARESSARAGETAENIERLEAMGRAPLVASGRRCPSAQEIRNMETGANSITLTRTERFQRQEQIRDARNCSH